MRPMDYERKLPRPFDPIDITIGANVRAIRLARELSQQTLADRMEVSFQAVQRWETGENRLYASRIVALADVLHCDIMDLYAGTEQFGDSPKIEVNDEIVTSQDVTFLRYYKTIGSPRTRQALKNLARALSGTVARVDD